jgi:DNA-binding PadR family transcriptional regulator
MTQRQAIEPADFLPLSPQQFHILLSLARQDRHGYGVIQDIAARTGETMGTGTLYTALARLAALELIDETGEDDGRRRHYRVTRLGRAVLDAEAVRLQALVRFARQEGLGRRPARPAPAKGRP